MPLPPPLMKGSGDVDRNRVRVHHHQRPIKKQRRHSEHDMTKRTLDSRMMNIKGEREDTGGDEDGDLDVDDFDDEERGVSPPTQTENVPPPASSTR